MFMNSRSQLPKSVTKNIFFNSSMPRSMSTLLQCVLNQNPNVCATATDPVLEYLYGARINYTSTPEVKATEPHIALRNWRGFCWGGLHGYAESYTEKPSICIKTRGAAIHYDWFKSFMPYAPKVVCMVRDLRSILASLEKIFRKNCETHHEFVRHAELIGTSTAKRVDYWLNTPPVGLALERIQQCFHEGISAQMHFIKAEDFTEQPQSVMDELYDYLELPRCLHDFNNVEQTVKEDDAVYGLTSDLHSIRSVIKPPVFDAESVLGKGICDYINNRFREYQTTFGYV